MQQQDGWNLIDLPGQYQMNVESVKPEDACQVPGDLNSLNLDDLLDGIFQDAPDGPAFEDTPFLHADDSSNPAESNSADFDPDDFFKYFDAEDNMFVANDSSEIITMGVGNNYLGESQLAPKIRVSSEVFVLLFISGMRWVSIDVWFLKQNVSGGSDLLPVASQLLPVPQEQGGSSSLKQYSETNELKSGKIVPYNI